jgi:nucleotide-binding universal stress UspA family protein
VPQGILSTTHTPRTSISGPPGSSGWSSGAGFPRTHTGSTSIDGGKYRKKVAFETFDDLPDTLFTFTAQAKSEGYKRSRNTRVFLVAVSPDESGEDALDWLMSELVEDGDEVIAMRVKDMSESERHTESAHEELRDEAKALLKTVLDKNDEEFGRKISAIVEIVVGPVQDMILKMIALYRPDSLIVGTKGQRSRLANWSKAFAAPGMGSISRFAVSHSPIPVVVVRPERKVKKTLDKREAAGKRGQYASLVGNDDLVLSRSRSRERSRSRDRRSVDLGRAISRDY